MTAPFSQPAGQAAESDVALALRPAASAPAQPAVDVISASPAGPGVGARALPPAVDAQTATGGVAVAVAPAGSATETAAGSTARPTASRAAWRAADVELALPVLDTITELQAAYENAIVDPDRRPSWSLRGDWNRAGTFDHPLSDMAGVASEVTVIRELSGDLPAEVGIVEGYSAASMQITLEGEWQRNLDGVDTGGTGGTGGGYGTSPYGTSPYGGGPTVDNSPYVDPVDAFAPYKPGAAFYARDVIGVPVELDTGFVTPLGPVEQRRFTGTVSRVSPSSSRRDVHLDSLDGANALRAAIRFGATGLDGLLLARYGSLAYNSRINSQWLIDYILRRNGVFASSPPPNDTVLSVTMHGSTIPEIGFGGVPTQVGASGVRSGAPWINTGHPNGMLYPNPASQNMTGTWRIERPLPLDSTTVVIFEALTLVGATSAPSVFFDVGPNARLAAYLNSDGNAQCYWQSATETYSTIGYPTGSGPRWIRLAWVFTFNTSSTVLETWADGVRLSQSTNAAASRPAPGNYYETVQPTYTVSGFTNLTVRWRRDTNYQLTGAWTSQADLDPGLNTWTGIPTIDGEESWPLIQEIVAAEYGSCGFSEEGRFWFRSRAVPRPHDGGELITSERTLADLVTVTDEAQIRNSITAAATPYLIGDWEWVYEATDLGELDSGPGVTTHDVPITEDTAIVWAEARGYNSETALTIPYTEFSEMYGFREKVVTSIIQAFNPTQYANGTVRITASLRSRNVVRLRIFNYTGVTIRFATPTAVDSNGNQTVGQPAFKLPGRVLRAQPSLVETIADAGSVAVHGERTFDLGGQSRWRQTRDDLVSLGGIVLAALGRAAPVLDSIVVTHDPRRQLHDPVTVVDRTGLGSVKAFIAAIRTTFRTTEAALDELTVRPVIPPGIGLLDDPDLGRVGSTLVFGA